jgi:hypothetical protein
MTPEFGAASQLEKIDMLDFADASRSTSSSAAAPWTPCATWARQLVRNLLSQWPSVVEQYSGDEHVVKIRDKELHTKLVKESLSGNPIRRVALPRMHDRGDLLTFLRRENLPGTSPSPPASSPSSARARTRRACSPARATPSAPTAVPLVSEGQPATRLSTAFDSVTLYGRDPDPRRTSTARSAPPASRSPPSTT